MKLRALALIALLALAACGGTTETKDSGPVSLRMTVWTSNEAHLKLFNEIAAAYKTDHPNVTEIKFDPIPFESYTTTLTTQIAGGNGPDLAWVLESSAPDFVSSGALVPLDGYDTADLVPSATKLWQKDGKLFAYPFSTSPFGVFVNTDLLKAAGQPTPASLIAEGKWNWDTVIAAASAVNAKTGKAGLVVRDFDYKSWDNLSTVWTGWGAQAWSADGKTCGFNQQPMVDAMTFLHKAIFTDKALPGPGTTADFFAGEAGMTITQISRASLLKDGNGRATAIASGLKASRPDLSVWIVSGDGDSLSIGGNHTIHLLRRNFDVNLLVFNNQIYGLTKGQYSPTSEENKITKSTPFGSIDHPFNPLALAMGADASFVARTMDRDPKHLQAMLLRTNQHKGSSFLEIYQNCNIFNDGAFEVFTEKSSKVQETLFLEQGKPFRFGAANNLGIKLDGFTPKVVNLDEGYSADDLWIHDEKDIYKAQILVRIFDDPKMEGHLPRPFGVFYQNDRPCYEDQMKLQLENAAASKPADLDKLLRGKEVWTIQ